jgi:hypothetical protein
MSLHQCRIEALVFFNCSVIRLNIFGSDVVFSLLKEHSRIPFVYAVVIDDKPRDGCKIL